MHRKIVIGIAGMPGAGKATAEEVFRLRGYPIVVMGDEVRAEAVRRNLKPSSKNLGELMLRIRAEEGPAALAKRCVPKIKCSKGCIVIVDGIRSPEEVAEFRRNFKDFVLVAIHASPKTRFRRLLKRGRSDDPRDWETFIERDRRELKVGLGEVIATADYMVINEDTREDLKRRMERILEEVLKR